MKVRSIVGAIFIPVVIACTALAQATRKSQDAEPPPLEKILAHAQSPASAQLAELIVIKPELPLGPTDVLQEYREAMAFIAQSMSADVTNITHAQEANQISREQAEHLIGERYQTAMMQYQVFSALHDMLEHDVAQEATRTERMHRTSESDTAVVVPVPSLRPSAEAK
jgi:hypothetical protein